MQDTYLDKLNQQQQHAVTTTEGPLLVLAGAGTGKTSVLTTRIAHILKKQLAYPSQILAVTFTNKAAREMKERIASYVENDHPDNPYNASRLWLGTFHAVAARILRSHVDAVGLRPQFAIINDDDQLRLVKQLLANHNIDEKKNPAKMFVNIIGRWKDQGLAVAEVLANAQSGSYSSNDESSRNFGYIYAGGIAPTIYDEYQQQLRAQNACDFGDLLLYNLQLFKHSPDVMDYYAQKFRYILVDEYQDTNIAQYLWLRLLASGHHNICCVGDEDQSIYAWRGAEIGNILRFEQDFPTANIIRLEENYRSSSHILGAASGLIAYNQQRLGKVLKASGKNSHNGSKVQIISCYDSIEEAEIISRYIISDRGNQQHNDNFAQTAILVRAGYQTRQFEESFVNNRIPYKVVGGLRFYERQEIRDVMAYLRLAVQPADGLAFERIINTPKRGVGKATIDKIRNISLENNISFFAAANSALDSGIIKGKSSGHLRKLIHDIKNWHQLLQDSSDGAEQQSDASLEVIDIAEFAKKILDDSGYIMMWQNDNSPEAKTRLDNIKELLRAIREFENLAEFLEHVSLVNEQNESPEQQNMVTIMTIHAAKGLEFEKVFLPGWEEGLFPSTRSIDESGQNGLEEERRLAYVAITRAKSQLFISHANRRRIYYNWQDSIPSRFLNELPKEHIESDMGRKNRHGYGNFSNNSRLNIINQNISDNSNDSGYNAGQNNSDGKIVSHAKFGRGKIISNNGGDIIEVLFDNSGRKKIKKDFLEYI